MKLKFKWAKVKLSLYELCVVNMDTEYEQCPLDIVRVLNSVNSETHEEHLAKELSIKLLEFKRFYYETLFYCQKVLSFV